MFVCLLILINENLSSCNYLKIKSSLILIDKQKDKIYRLSTTRTTIIISRKTAIRNF